MVIYLLLHLLELLLVQDSSDRLLLLLHLLELLLVQDSSDRLLLLLLVEMMLLLVHLMDALVKALQLYVCRLVLLLLLLLVRHHHQILQRLSDGWMNHRHRHWLLLWRSRRLMDIPGRWNSH